MTLVWTVYLRICLFDSFDVCRENDQRVIASVLCLLCLPIWQKGKQVCLTRCLHMMMCAKYIKYAYTNSQVKCHR